jgi:5'-methylthioadenosine phosphorylase
MAQLIGLVQMGIEKVVAMSAVGSADERFGVGDIVVPDQFIDLTRSRISTFYDHAAVHTDMTVPLCPQLRGTLLAELGDGDFPFSVHDGGTYACTEGPRYETAAEVHMIRTLGGQLIGSSAGPEIALARELGLCYALVTMVANLAAGYQQRVDSRDILETIWSNSPKMSTGLVAALRETAGSPAESPCTDNEFEAGRLRARLLRKV